MTAENRASFDRRPSRVPSIGLALGGGSARGLAHIVMLEALDELGLAPNRIAGTSIGAIVGGQYAAGLAAAEIKEFTEELLGRRSEMFRRIAGSLDGLAALWSVRAPSVVDGVTLFEMVLPSRLRTTFEALPTPFVAVTTDYGRMSQSVIAQGPLIPAIAASAALPTILRPVAIEGRLLVDGGFVNPTPFDLLQDTCDIVIAVDVTGSTRERAPSEVLNPFEAWVGATQIMFHSIVREKCRIRPPDIMVRPGVGAFGTLDFRKFRDIFAASAPAKDQLKRDLDRLIEGR